MNYKLKHKSLLSFRERAAGGEDLQATARR